MQNEVVPFYSQISGQSTPRVPLRRGQIALDHTTGRLYVMKADGNLAKIGLETADVSSAVAAGIAAAGGGGGGGGGLPILNNGSFSLAQRGNGPASVSGALIADNWGMLLGASATATMERVEIPAANRSEGSHAIKITITNMPIGGSINLSQAIEGADALRPGSNHIMSCRVRLLAGSGTRAVRMVCIRRHGTGGSTQFTHINNVAAAPFAIGGWASQSVASPSPLATLDALTVTADAQIIADVRLLQMDGWNTGDEVLITVVKIEPGTLATPYVRQPPAITLQRAQREAQLIGGLVGGQIAQGFALSTTQAVFVLRLEQTMRGTPTVAVGSLSGFNLVTAGGVIVSSNVEVTNITPAACAIVVTVASGLTPGEGCRLSVNNVAGTLLFTTGR
jgi:hypothetical protein